MVLRFRRSFALFQRLRLNISRSGVTGSIGHRGAWLTLGARGARATVAIPGTGLSYSEQSPWARPKPPRPTSAGSSAPGVEVRELPLDEIEVTPAGLARDVRIDSAAPEGGNHAEGIAVAGGLIDDEEADPRLVPIALAVVAIVAIAALASALLV